VVFFAKYNQKDQVKEDEIDRACTMHGEELMHIELLWEIQKERDH
jgi:hypothetical protein